jgi:hypothetical protein
MQDYLMRALQDDIGVLKFINVIRVITGRSIIHNGVDGEEHYSSVRKRERIALESSVEEIELESEEENENEEVEIDDIISSYVKKD